MVGRIFISYRRDDDPGAANLVNQTLRKAFPSGQVYFDVASIEPGADFRARIDEQVRDCDVLVAIIGRHWLAIKGRDGQRRLDDPRDLVAYEIEAAFRQGKTVVPLLSFGVTMPDETDLPDRLKPLAARNARRLTSEGADGELTALCDALRKQLEQAEARRQAAADAVEGRARADAELAARNRSQVPKPLNTSRANTGWLGRLFGGGAEESAPLLAEHTIVPLLGYAASGKTSLIVAAGQVGAVDHGARGYHYWIKENARIFRADCDDLRRSRHGTEQIRCIIHRELKQSAFLGRRFEPMATLGVYRTPFDVTVVRDGFASASGTLMLIDAGGNLWFGNTKPMKGEDQFELPRRQALSKLLDELDCAVLCLPVGRDNSWFDDYSRVLDWLLHGMSPKGHARKRLAIAFTQIDRLTCRGPRNHSLLDDKVEMREWIWHALAGPERDFLRRLQLLAADTAMRCDIRCFPTSAFGFLDDDFGFIVPNNLEADEEHQTTGNLALWNPYNACEPVLYAAVGEQLTFPMSFTLEELLE